MARGWSLPRQPGPLVGIRAPEPSPLFAVSVFLPLLLPLLLLLFFLFALLLPLPHVSAHALVPPSPCSPSFLLPLPPPLPPSPHTLCALSFFLLGEGWGEKKSE